MACGSCSNPLKSTNKIYKRPDEEILVAVDFEPWLQGGLLALEGTPQIAVPTGSSLTTGTPLIDGTTVEFLISGGSVSNSDYCIVCRVDASDGTAPQTFEAELSLRVAACSTDVP